MKIKYVGVSNLNYGYGMPKVGNVMFLYEEMDSFLYYRNNNPLNNAELGFNISMLINYNQWFSLLVEVDGDKQPIWKLL